MNSTVNITQEFCWKKEANWIQFLVEIQNHIFPMPRKFDPSTPFSLNYVIRQCLSSNRPRIALAHLQCREQGVKPDKFTIPSLIKLSVALEEPQLHGEQFHSFAIKSGYIRDLFIGSSLVEMYFKHGDFGSPVQLFSDMPEKDAALFTSMISGFSQNGLSCDALCYFGKMLMDAIEPNMITLTTMLSLCSQLKNLTLGKILHGFSIRRSLLAMVDVILNTATVDMYAKCGSLCYAKRAFDRMSERNLVSWHSIIIAYFSNGFFTTALSLFKGLILEGEARPRSSTLAAVLSICGTTTDLRKGKEVHSFILKCENNGSELESLVEYNAIIDMYVKSGDINSAMSLFTRIPKKNLVAYTTMIWGYGTHGLTRKALDAFDKMKRLGIRPDGVSFLAIISACSHSGLIDEGRKLYLLMTQDYDIVPEMKHFVCMVDLYGRAGLLQEAFEFIKTMPVKPSKFVWGALLSSCRNHKNFDLGEFAAKKAIELDRYDVGNYLLLSRLYVDARRWEDVAKVRLEMKELGIKADTAFSWVEMKGKVYRFTVGDRLNVYSREMCGLLEKAGFEPDTLAGGHNLEHEEEKVSDLCSHTEKVALAFMLMRCGGEKLIRIGKNLRVCRDCHEAFKFASKVYDREIILKDPNRYHRFAKGCCSCNDFW